MWRGKTVDYVDTSAVNCWTIHFTDGTKWIIEAESAGIYGLQQITATEVDPSDSISAIVDREKIDLERKEIWKALRAVAEGYPVQGFQDRYVIVQNPEYSPWNGEPVNIVVDLSEEKN